VLNASDGRVTRGRDVAPGAASATLLVRHAPGLVLAWVDRAGEEAQDLWGRTALPDATPVTPPAIVPLGGEAQALEIQAPGPVMLHLRTATPIVTRLVRGAEPPEIDVHPGGASVDAYVPGGPARLALRAAGGGTLWGSAEITTSPVVPIREGLGPKQLLPAGGAALFSFVLATEREVGVGVRAVPDVVDLALLDAHAKRLGAGVVQMQKLPAGTYLVAVHAPPGRGPVEIRPALAGIELPGTGPPEDVVRGYVAMAGEAQ
jgi:hypothetical protein